MLRQEKRGAQVLGGDMDEATKASAIDCARRALKELSDDEGIAAFMRKEFDWRYGGGWQAIVAPEFVGYVFGSSASCYALAR